MVKKYKYMYHRIFLIALSLVLLTAYLQADELDDKMQQLRQIERQIEEVQQKARQAEQKKKKAQSDLSSSQKAKLQTDKLVTDLQKKEAVVQDSLQAARERVRSNEDKITDLKELANHEFLRLFYIDRQDKYVVKETKDKHLLSILISLTAKGIFDFTEYHKQLILTEEERRNEFYRVRSSRVKETRKSDQYGKKIRTLSQQATNLEKERQKFEQQISKLKKDASELESLIARLAAESDRALNTYQFSTLRIPWPVRGQIIRDFGEEYRGNNTSVISNGIDIAVAENTNVAVVDDGEVVFAERYGGQGKLIIIDHKNGFFSVYAYNNELLVSRGASVKKGQTIAKSGKTGSASQPSLHFELRKDGRAVNPLSYLE
ncbi:MAG: peptidoglycan DD-metalloendopeptidase family protein [Candidatus Cloacimonadaceae bacterium]